jgi:hypothetical protein
MGLSTVTYRVVLMERWTAAGLRRCWEICECDVNGRVRRAIARTPVIVGEGEGEAEEARYAEARDEARRMLAAFTGPAK